jgi:hypothetical protein
MTGPTLDSRRRPWLRILAAWLVCAGVAGAVTWPLVTQLGSTVPMGGEKVATVPLLNLWTVWWNADRAAAGFRGYWDAPIFYPTPRTFIFSEAQPTTLVVAPLVWLTGRPALGYNVYLLATLTLNGGLTFHLLRRCGLRDVPALLGGVLTQTLPYVGWQLGVLQLAQLWPAVWMLWGIVRWIEWPRWRTALEIGVVFAVTYASCNYYGLYAAMLLPPTGLWLLRRPVFTLRSLGQVGLAGLLAAALMGPIVWLQRHTAAEHDWQREELQVIGLSAHLRDYTDTPWPQWLDRWEIPAEYRTNVWVLGPGWLKLITAVLGLLLGLVLSGQRRWTLAVLTLGGLALLLSLGPSFELWGLSPYRGLRQFVPGFGQTRSPFRFAVFVQLAVVWLCAGGLHRLHPGAWWPAVAERCGRWRGLASGLAWLPMLVLGGVLLAETRPPRQRLHPIPGPQELPLWVEFVRDETPVGAPLICLPVALGTSVRDYEPEATWMFWGTHHRRPLLNGYSGYFPESYVTLNSELDHFPRQGVPRALQMGARYAAVDRERFSESLLARHPATKDWVWLFSDGPGGVDIYQLPDPPDAGFDSSAEPVLPVPEPADN